MLKTVLSNNCSGLRKQTSLSECVTSYFSEREVLALSSKVHGRAWVHKRINILFLC